MQLPTGFAFLLSEGCHLITSIGTSASETLNGPMAEGSESFTQHAPEWRSLKHLRRNLRESRLLRQSNVDWFSGPILSRHKFGVEFVIKHHRAPHQGPVNPNALSIGQVVLDRVVPDGVTVGIAAEIGHGNRYLKNLNLRFSNFF